MRPLFPAGLETSVRQHWRAVFAFLLPFSMVLYLALQGGGYDPVTRGVFGVVIWVIVAVGAAAGLVSTAGWTRAAWAIAALFGAFTVWTGLAVIWSDSVEKTVSEFARAAAYGGVLALGLFLGTRENFKRIVAGVGAALAVVSLLALASRLHPQWFPENAAAEILPETIKRLNYPLGYWNALAALVAIGVPLMLWLASSAAHRVVRALAAAVIPAMALTGYMTLSRGGVVEIAVAAITFIALYPGRITLLPTIANVAIGSAILVFLASRRADLSDGLTTATASHQADQMIVAVIAVALVVGLLQWAIAAAGARGVGPRPVISRTTTIRIWAVALVAAVVVGIAAGAPGRISDAWETFKAPAGPSSGDTIQRFSSASGNGRYQYWSASLDGATEEPLTGLGPGTWEFLWARDGTLPTFVRDAHSLYLETFAELGIVGLVIILALMGSAVVLAVRRTRRATPQMRVALAAATAATAAFVTASSLDWSWELPVIPTAALLIVGAIATCERGPLPAGAREPWSRRLTVVAAATVGVAMVALPLPGLISIRASQDSFNAGNLPKAIDQAETAEALQPWAAAPTIQKALVLEQDGQLEEAQAAAAEATSREPANWRNWYVLARLDFHLGLDEQAAQATETARSLNPRSALFATSPPPPPQ